MIEFKLNGKKISIPSKWEDLTFKQYVYYMETKGTIPEILSLFTGIDQETISKATITGLEEVITALSFLNTKAEFNSKPDKVGKYKLPLNSNGEFDIRFESLGQFEDMRKALEKSSNAGGTQFVNAYALYIAIYLQKIRDGDYDYIKALEMIPEIELMPAHEVISVGSFFTVKLLSLLTGTTNSFPATSQTMKKSKPVFQSSPKRSAATRQSRKSR
jgi:hypothetical protein